MGKVKKNKVESMTSVGPRILTPHALPMFQDEESKSLKRKREKERKDPVLSHRPDLPVTGKGRRCLVTMDTVNHVMRCWWACLLRGW
jgi:hypothetical protein